MKKTLVAAIIGLCASASVMAQGRVSLESYLSGNYPTITYGAGSGGTVGVGIDTSFHVGLFYSLTGGLSFSDATGIAAPTGNGWTLATGTGAVAPIYDALPGLYGGVPDFTIPGWIDPAVQSPGNGPISVVVIAYNGPDYASATIRGHSAAFNMSPGTGANQAPYTGLAQGSGFQVLPVAAVPEPSTFALAGLGLAALTIFRRRK